MSTEDVQARLLAQYSKMDILLLYQKSLLLAKLEWYIQRKYLSEHENQRMEFRVKHILKKSAWIKERFEEVNTSQNIKYVLYKVFLQLDTKTIADSFVASYIINASNNNVYAKNDCSKISTHKNKDRKQS